MNFIPFGTQDALCHFNFEYFDNSMNSFKLVPFRISGAPSSESWLCRRNCSSGRVPQLIESAYSSYFHTPYLCITFDLLIILLNSSYFIVIWYLFLKEICLTVSDTKAYWWHCRRAQAEKAPWKTGAHCGQDVNVLMTCCAMLRPLCHQRS